jgi:hypothetical protein
MLSNGLMESFCIEILGYIQCCIQQAMEQYNHYYVIPIVPDDFDSEKDIITAVFARNSRTNYTNLEELYGNFSKIGVLDRGNTYEGKKNHSVAN